VIFMNKLPKRFQRKLKPWLAPSQSPSLKDIYWAAGIWEGEGTCSSSHGTTSYARITQEDPWLLEKFQKLFGGSIKSIKSSQFKPDKEYPIWILSGVRARGFLMTIYTLLSPKKQEQIKRSLDY